MRRASSVAVLALLTGGLLATPTTPAHADGADAYGRVCNPDRYRTHYKVTSLAVQPVVTYEKSYQLSPHEQWVTSKEIALDRQVKVDAEMTFNSSTGGSLSLPAKLVGSIEAKTDLQFRSSGTATRTRVQRTYEERRFGNPDDRNRKLIFFRGLTRAKGRFTKYACYQHYLPGQSYGPFEVHIYYGRYRTWTDHVGLSHLLCGHRADGRLANLVKKHYCPL